MATSRYVDVDALQDEAKNKLLKSYTLNKEFDLEYKKENTFSLDLENIFGLEMKLNSNENNSTLERLMVNSLDDKSWIYIKFKIDETNYVMNLYIPKLENNQSTDYLNEYQDRLDNSLKIINQLTFDGNDLVIDLKENIRLHYDAKINEFYFVENKK